MNIYKVQYTVTYFRRTKEVVDAHVKRVILEMANSHKSNKAQAEARESEKANKHDF